MLELHCNIRRWNLPLELHCLPGAPWWKRRGKMATDDIACTICIEQETSCCRKMGGILNHLLINSNAQYWSTCWYYLTQFIHRIMIWKGRNALFSYFVKYDRGMHFFPLRKRSRAHLTWFVKFSCEFLRKENETRSSFANLWKIWYGKEGKTLWGRETAPLHLINLWWQLRKPSKLIAIERGRGGKNMYLIEYVT